MRVYHGVPSYERLARLESLAPSVEHGAEWLPERLSEMDVRCILDNGAYGGSFDPERWRYAVEEVTRDVKRTPDFCVLPDVFQDWQGTIERHRRFVGELDRRGLEGAVVAQPPAGPDEVARVADELEVGVVFVGGGLEYTYRGAGRQVVRELSGSYHVHVGEPGESLARPFRLGADSIDTVAGTRREAYGRFRRLERFASGSGLGRDYSATG